MSVRPSAAPDAALSSQEQQVQRAEQEASALEARLAAQSERLEASARQLGARRDQLAQSLAGAGLDGVRSQALEALQRRVEARAVTAPGLGEPRAQALRARAEAVEARARASEEIRQRLAGFDAALLRLHAQLSEDEAQAAQLVREHRAQQEEEAARAAEAKARRDAAQAARAQELRAEPPAATGGPAAAGKGAPRAAPVQLEATVDLQSDSNFFQGFSSRISEGGLFVATERRLAPGTPVELRFTVPGGRSLQGRGVVRWAREANDRTPEIAPGLGVGFSELGPEATEAIRSFVSQREPLFFAE